MAQEDKKIKPNFLDRGGDDKNPKKGPRLSIYWIYAMIAVFIIGWSLLKQGVPDVTRINEQEFKQQMLLPKDVSSLDFITNKELVRVHIYKDSLGKPYYQKLFKGTTPTNANGPLFEFKITDWKSFQDGLSDFYKTHQLAEVPTNVTNEGEWFGPIANTLVTILLFVGLWVLLMRKMGGGGLVAAALAAFSILENQKRSCLIKAQK